VGQRNAGGEAGAHVFITEIDEAGWVKVLDAGPSLLALELRQVGGRLRQPRDRRRCT
jgi:hypothetical protein